MTKKLIASTEYLCEVLIEPMTIDGKSKKLDCGIPLYTVMWKNKGNKQGYAAIMDLLNLLAPDPEFKHPVPPNVLLAINSIYGKYLKEKTDKWIDEGGLDDKDEVPPFDDPLW